jgi:DNA replication and repair protein RecF
VTGANGVGKTNLLEGMHLGSQGFSPRTRVDAHFVRFRCPFARARVVGSEAGREVETEVTVRRGEGKRVQLNGAALASAEELRARLSVLVFLPDRLAVVKGGPLVRRAYFDRMLGRLYPTRASLPSEYGRALAQRNEALRRARAGISTRGAIAPWTERVATLGSELELVRAELVAALTSHFAERAATLALESAELAYEPRELTMSALAERLERDIARGVTSAGPHLRDVSITAGGRDLRSFGSQGEQRAAVLALVLAEAVLVVERRGSPPLLLLDDVLSELDASRRAALLSSLPRGGQTVVTATTSEALPRGAPGPDVVVGVSPGEARRL